EGYISGYGVRAAGNKRELEVRLKYGSDRSRVIKGLRRVSRPGRRVYAAADELPRTRGGLGVVIISTSQGLLPDREARRRKLGGEVVCEVW
ncbi:MAG: ribosomal protein, partial [Actinobacteria bacterium]|nr:ribosomal protein [Actinomycetota bacterium]